MPRHPGLLKGGEKVKLSLASNGPCRFLFPDILPPHAEGKDHAHHAKAGRHIEDMVDAFRIGRQHTRKIVTRHHSPETGGTCCNNDLWSHIGCLYRNEGLQTGRENHVRECEEHRAR